MDNATPNSKDNSEISHEIDPKKESGEEEQCTPEGGWVHESFIKVNKTEVLAEIAHQQETEQQHPPELSHEKFHSIQQNPDAKFLTSIDNDDNSKPSGTTSGTSVNDAVLVEDVDCGGFPAENRACENNDDGGFPETASGLEDYSNQLPEDIKNRLVVLQCESTAPGGVCDVYLVGTAHVSEESCREVKTVIHCLKPQVIFLELCSSRMSLLTPQVLMVPSLSEMVDSWKNKNMNALGILYSWFLAKVADKLEVFPGSEFRIAYEEAMTYGARVILGDRPVQITLRRTWAKMSLWQKTKFIFLIIFQAISLPSAEELNKMMMELGDVDILTLVIQEMSKTFPSLIETLVHERDLYMSSTLLKVASESNSVVAVVGRGHLSGIKEKWKQPVPICSLLEVPVRSSSSVNVWTAVALAVGGSAILSGVYLMGRK